ncbi:MAG: cadmium-translocating P-type ATPase [Firmicutes bacterium]|nr:cadmium-translocating P-type ATPase [Bacillota bacterium]
MSSKTFLQRATVAIVAVLCFAIYDRVGLELLHWIGLSFYAVCFIMYAKALFTSLIKTKKITADLLVITVMVVSLLAGQPLSGALVAWFISTGLAISFAVIERTRRKIESLTKERQKTARVFRDDTILELPVEQIRAGDVVIVPQGGMITVDGEIIEGASAIDESVITGEPFPIFKEVGDLVTSGAISLTSQLNVKANKPGDKGYLHIMAREIEEHLKVKPKIHQTADKIVQFFIPGVVLFAIGVFIYTWNTTSDITIGLIRMAAVTAVACPCAWALSVPTAFAAAIGGLSGQGILANGGIPLELVGAASSVILDKTGTITLAEPQVVGIDSFNMPENDLLQIAASVESGFDHPIASAIIAHAAAEGIAPLEVTDSQYLPGLGIKAFIEDEEVILGSAETMKTLDLDVSSEAKFQGRPTWIKIGDTIEGAIVIQDELRDYVTNLGESLRDLGIQKVVLATGDNEKTEAQRVAEVIKADEYRWGLKPDDKVALVKEFNQDGFTVMVGDGVNDATALAAADVGISIGHTKADLAIKSSDIIILRDDATSILGIVQMGKKLTRIIKQNYAWAIAFNLAGILLATKGILSPWAAALFHHLSSVLVVVNSARLGRAAKPAF